MERNDAIITLEVLKANCSKHSRDYQALEYAINSLKTDEKYQIMYEGEDIFTKADMVAMLTELKTAVDIMSDTVVEDRTVTITSWLGMQKRISKLIQSKIDKLEER
jgi:hypothetical protein